jgi:hypothetical protein
VEKKQTTDNRVQITDVKREKKLIKEEANEKDDFRDVAGNGSSRADGRNGDGGNEHGFCGHKPAGNADSKG